MAHLLNKPVHHPLSDDVQVIHDLQPNDINLDYIGLKVLDIKSGGNYEEATEDFELCIVALTGKAREILYLKKFQQIVSTFQNSII